jgi:hypothetical protein
MVLEPLPRGGTFHRRHVGRWYGPKSPYVPFLLPIMVLLAPSGIAGPGGRCCLVVAALRYNSVYDWGYGSAPADRLPGYPGGGEGTDLWCTAVRRSPSQPVNDSAYPRPEDGFLGAADPCAGRPECARVGTSILPAPTTASSSGPALAGACRCTASARSGRRVAAERPRGQFRSLVKVQIGTFLISPCRPVSLRAARWRAPGPGAAWPRLSR